MDNKNIKLESVSKIDTSDYVSFHKLNIDIDGSKTSIVIGKKSTSIGIDIIFGHEILGFLDTHNNVLKDVSDIIKNSE